LSPLEALALPDTEVFRSSVLVTGWLVGSSPGSIESVAVGVGRIDVVSRVASTVLIAR